MTEDDEREICLILIGMTLLTIMHAEAVKRSKQSKNKKKVKA